MKMRWLIPLSGLLVWLLGSCASNSPGGGSYEAAKGRSATDNATGGSRPSDGAGARGLGSGVSSSEAFAAPKKERPGLATTFGKAMDSPSPSMSFERATSKPYGVDVIYYNNREGLKAMDALDSKVDGFQTAAGGVLEWGIKGAFGFLPTYRSYPSYSRGGGDNRRFVEGSHGSTYSIVLHNRCKADLQVVLSVDGLDVIDGKPASVTKRGYVVPAGKTLEVKGYRTGYGSVAAFQFSSVSGSYANLSRGDTRNVGVIGLAVYTPKGGDPWTWMPKEINNRLTADPFAKAP